MQGARVIRCGNTSNFRDLGGYVTADGRHRTRWGRLYRSDALSKVPVCDTNVAHMRDELNIVYAIDFRSQGERTAEPYLLPNIPTFAIPVEPGNVLRLVREAPELTERVCVECMSNLYRSFVNDHKASFAKFFRVLVDKVPDKRAVVFHCTAGKDRTGYAAFLLLSVLGVSMETILADYLLTNEHFKPPPIESFKPLIGSKRADAQGLHALCTVREEYLRAAMATIHERAPDVTAYVTSELGVTAHDVDVLRARYLEPVPSS